MSVLNELQALVDAARYGCSSMLVQANKLKNLRFQVAHAGIKDEESVFRKFSRPSVGFCGGS